MSKKTAAAKAEAIKKFQATAGDTGSPEVQAAVLTARMTELSGHLATHPNDLHSRRGLLTMVAKRRRILDYLKSKDEARYKKLIESLGIRR